MNHFLSNDEQEKAYFGDSSNEAEVNDELKRLENLIEESFGILNDAKDDEDWDLVRNTLSSLNKLCEDREDVKKYGL